MRSHARQAFAMTGAVCTLGASFVIMTVIALAALAMMGVVGVVARVRA